MKNKKYLWWGVAAFLAGGAFAARQNIITNQEQQPPPAVAQNPSGVKRPAPKPSAPKEHDVVIILIAELPKSGNAKDIGCGNTVKTVTRKSTFKGDPVEDALNVLFAQKKAGYKKGELYNALYQSHLKVQSVETKAGVVTVKLTGDIKLSGVCDIPRVKAQLEETIRAASEVENVRVLVNEKNLDEALSLKE